jgi:hypothetical protein
VREVQGEALEAPLEGSSCVVGLAEALRAMGSEGGPFTVGVGEDAWGVVGEVGVGLVAGSVEVGVGEGRGGRFG